MKKGFTFLLLLAVLLGAFVGHKRNRGLFVETSPRVLRSNAPVADAVLPKHLALPALTIWQALEVRDYPRFIEMLRASGCPEETIRDLVMMRVTREFCGRAMAIEEQWHLNVEWWRSYEDDAMRSAKYKEMRHLRREMDDRVYDLLGISYQDLMAGFFGYMDAGSQEAWLAPEKRRALLAMQDRFTDEIEELRRGRAVLDDEKKAQLAELEKQHRAELVAFLSPSELEDYDVRNSDAARYVLKKLPPALSEKEFRIMVKVAQEKGAVSLPGWEHGYEYGTDLAAAIRANEVKKQEVLDQIKVVLGEEAVAAQEKLGEELKAKEQAEIEERHAREFVTQISEVAESVGVDKAAGQLLFDRIELLKKEWHATLPPPSAKMSEDEKRQILDRIYADVEKASVEIMGDKGHEFMAKFKEKFPL